MFGNNFFPIGSTVDERFDIYYIVGPKSILMKYYRMNDISTYILHKFVPCEYRVIQCPFHILLALYRGRSADINKNSHFIFSVHQIKGGTSVLNSWTIGTQFPNIVILRLLPRTTPNLKEHYQEYSYSHWSQHVWPLPSAYQVRNRKSFRQFPSMSTYTYRFYTAR